MLFLPAEDGAFIVASFAMLSLDIRFAVQLANVFSIELFLIFYNELSLINCDADFVPKLRSTQDAISRSNTIE